MIAATAPESPLGWIEVALVIFFAVFVLITLGVLFRRRGAFDHAANIPLTHADLETQIKSDDQGGAS
jgi:TRAP-type C4-dicarboxylate transport system permease small subunit